MAFHAERYLRLLGIAAIATLALGYGAFEMRNLIAGPVIQVDTPRNGATVATSLLTISGNARNISFISLNDKKIFVDEGGRFEQSLLLSYGYNIITLHATDRFGRDTTEVLEILYK